MRAAFGMRIREDRFRTQAYERRTAMSTRLRLPKSSPYARMGALIDDGLP